MSCIYMQKYHNGGNPGLQCFLYIQNLVPNVCSSFEPFQKVESLTRNGATQL
jgi:hypothetical protein